MDLSEVIKSAEAQDAGHVFELLDPVSGDPTGLKLRIVGPDSKVAKDARLAVEKEVARLSARRGGITAEDRDRLMEDLYATLVIGWDVKEKGKAVPFSKEALLRLLRAGTWVRAQVDAFAGDRGPYFKVEG